MMNRPAMKNKLMTYFNEGAKPNGKGIGVEIEHFLIDDKTLRSYRYDEAGGQKDLLLKLMDKGWILLNEEKGSPLGIEKDGSTITLEPGGQVEISLKVFTDIPAIERTYHQIIEEMKSVLEDGQSFVALGYHPKSKIEDLPLLPKERYYHMFDYFKTHGSKSHYMMKGTAATQVSIDYKDEMDFIKKIRVAHFVGPILSRIFDASPVFQGDLIEGHNLRIDIWNNTDPVRSKYPPRAFEGIFGFDEYAEYLLKTPPIFTKLDDDYLFTGDLRLEEIIELHNIERIDLDHIVGMVFPDVRLKKYLEIRMADSLKPPYVFALAAIIKGIFYNEATLDRYYDFAKKYDLEDALAVNERLLSELDFNHKDISMNWFMMKIMLDAKSNLSEEERKPIDLLFEQINLEGSYNNKLKGLYKEDKEAFLSAIRV